MTLNDLITKYDLNAAEQTELSEYVKNRFEGIPEGRLEDYEQLPIWRKLAALSQLAGAAEIINKKITPKLPVEFKDPDSIRLEIFDSFAGAIPMIYTGSNIWHDYLAEVFGDHLLWASSIYSPYWLSWGDEWTVMQYSSRGELEGYSGHERYIDLNVLAKGVRVDDLRVK